MRRPMFFCFVDDARRPNPSRQGMGPLFGLGGIVLPADTVHEAEAALAALCKTYGFPAGEEFKRSPSSAHWMAKGLTGNIRQTFFLDVIDELKAAGAHVMVVALDTTCAPATGFAVEPEDDATVMFVERLQHRLVGLGGNGVLIADRPGGGRKQESAFLVRFIHLMEEGTEFVKPERIGLSALVADSKHIRLLQAADLVVSTVLAFVGGEKKFSKEPFDAIRPLMFSEYGRVGGVGLKLHPDGRYRNLYHWLLGDDTWVRYQSGIALPLRGYSYYESPDIK